jgi:raffinose/stachyose/melibiose transport system permease protein
MTLQFFMHWNNYIFPATFISRIKLRTIQTGLMSFTGEYGEVDWGPTFAAVTIAIFPTLFIYLFMSKMIIRGMTAGAIKG